MATTCKTQNELLLNNLLHFYKNQEYLKKMVQIIRGESKISLRIVDWFVTNYAKKNFTVYTIDNHLGEPVRFKVYNEYKLKLKAYSKKRFDPFCRYEKTMFPYDGTRYIETTIGQLNFFKWAFSNKIINYAIANQKIIYENMSKNSYKKITKKKKNSLIPKQDILITKCYVSFD